MPHSKKSQKLLIVDDEESVRDSLKNWFLEDGYEIDAAKDAYEALDLLEKSSYGVVLLDIKMPGMDGLELQEKIRAQDKSINIIMSSGVDYEFRTTCVKPFVDPDIIESICEHIAGAKRYCLQKFSSTNVLDPGFFEAGGSPCGDDDMEALRDIAAKHVQECIIR